MAVGIIFGEAIDGCSEGSGGGDIVAARSYGNLRAGEAACTDGSESGACGSAINLNGSGRNGRNDDVNVILSEAAASDAHHVFAREQPGVRQQNHERVGVDDLI